jgi:hypothetical protein
LIEPPAEREATGMSNLFHFAVFRVNVVEEASSVNVAELVFNMPRFTSKHNQGHGDNIGDGQIVPSRSLVHDPDVYDMPVGYGLLPLLEATAGEVKP